MREIGSRLVRSVLPPLPEDRTPAGRLAGKRRPRMTLARGRWIPPRERVKKETPLLPIAPHKLWRSRRWVAK
ncbi:MAG: hypothetical protein JXR84_15165 [Anaerolineae bacterium]|nr:hypothetical protein [Anaerolineae bacterium]